MQALVRTAARGAAQACGPQVRRMSGGGSLELEVKEMNKWRNITIAAIPLCIVMAAWDLTHADHEHHEKKIYSYMHIRNKEFPWGDCALFDKECWDEQRKAAAEKEDE